MSPPNPTTANNLQLENVKSQIKMKLKQYNSMQMEYNQLLQSSIKSRSEEGSPNWKKAMKTDILFLSTIGDYFWGSRGNGDVFSCPKPCDGEITTTSKSAYNVSTDGKNVYLAGRDNTLAKRPADPNAPGDWTPVPTPTVFYFILSTPDTPGAAFGNKLWGLDGEKKLYVCDKPCKDSKDWTIVKTTSVPYVHQMTVDDDYIWVLSTDGAPGAPSSIYKQKLSCGITGADKWEEVITDKDVSLSWLDATNSKYLTATSDQGFLYQCEKPCSDGNWRKIDSKPNDKSIFTVSGVPDNETIYANTQVDGTWSYDANSVFTSKYSWNDQENKNAGGADIANNKEWSLLGSVDTLEECKEKAAASNDTFSRIVYYTPQYSGDQGKSKSCYGLFYNPDSENSQTPSSLTDMQNVVTSNPPDGVSKIGGKKAYQLLENMQNVQKGIADLIDSIEATKQKVQLSQGPTASMNELTETLNRNRGLINETLLKSNVFAKEEIASLKENTSYLHYLIWLVMSIVCIGLAIYLVRNDGATVPRIVYVLLAFFILYNLQAYFFAFTDTTRGLLGSVSSTLYSG